MRGISAIRRFVDRRSGWNFGSICSVSRFHETQISTPINFSSPTISLKLPFANVYSTKIQFSCPSLQLQRTLSSSAGSSKTVLIKSEEQFNNSLKDVQDKSLPAIFYFTAKWCGPCKFISPILAEQSEKYPNVTTFKIDIDQEGLESLLSRLSIISVPSGFDLLVLTCQIEKLLHHFVVMRGKYSSLAARGVRFSEDTRIP